MYLIKILFSICDVKFNIIIIITRYGGFQFKKNRLYVWYVTYY
jgi:hypothetical protein